MSDEEEVELTVEEKAIKEIRDKAVFNIKYYTEALVEAELQLKIIDAGIESVKKGK